MCMGMFVCASQCVRVVCVCLCVQIKVQIKVKNLLVCDALRGVMSESSKKRDAC